MKTVIAQTESEAGRIDLNFEKIKKCIIKAKEENADLIIFPEYSLTGYPFGDILKRHKFLFEEQNHLLNEIIKLTDNICVITGFADKNSKSSFSIMNNGEITEENPITISGEKFYIITGDYDSAPTDTKENIIHLSASDSRNGKEYLKNKTLSEIAKNNGIHYIYVNKAGYSDNRCFDGASRIYDPKGIISARAKSFEEDFLVTDNFKGRIENLPKGSEEKLSNEFKMEYENDLDRLYQSLLCGIKGYFRKNGFSKAVLGLSGGLDSTICAVLLTDALGKENVTGISMPTKISSQSSKDDAKELAENLGITYIEAPIGEEVDVFKTELNKIFAQINQDKYNVSTTFENVQARTRATLLWSISNEFKGMLPIATSDKSEGYIGYATTNGDMSGAFAPISDVTKTKLFALGKFLNKNRTEKNAIPQNILEKPPGAELKFDKEKGRTITAEEDNMPYPFLDEVIWNIENYGLSVSEMAKKEFFFEKNNPVSKEQKQEWLNKFSRKYKNAVFKWHLMPPGIITDRATINQAEYYHPIV